MPERIEYAGSVAVVGGPQFSFKRTIESGAYSKFRVEVKRLMTRKIDLGTSSTDSLRLLAITSTDYDPKITFVIDPPDAAGPSSMAGTMGSMSTGATGATGATGPSASTAPSSYTLDQPLLIAGTAGLKLIGTTLSNLEFKNDFPNKDVTIDVVLVREP